MTKQIRDILRDLDSTRENLLSFSDEVWLNIDHNDTSAMIAGAEFKKRLNEQLDNFAQLSVEITKLVQEYTKVHTEGEAQPETEVGETVRENERIVKELNRNEPHSLTEDFTYKRPSGFILEGQGYRDVTIWTRMYELTLRHVAKTNPKLFNELPDNADFISNRGNHSFSRSMEALRRPLALPGGIYAESNLSANDICKTIIRVLELFDIPLTACTIFLREDRNA